MFSVFSLVLDQDVQPKLALTYPELYKKLAKGRSLSFKTFFMWVLISIYQGGIIMYGALLLFEDKFIHIVSISFTSLILTELLMKKDEIFERGAREPNGASISGSGSDQLAARSALSPQFRQSRRLPGARLPASSKAEEHGGLFTFDD
ncbi:hypothetical protein MRX96_010681 [Rhipicephalus microplus]